MKNLTYDDACNCCNRNHDGIVIPDLTLRQVQRQSNGSTQGRSVNYEIPLAYIILVRFSNTDYSYRNVPFPE